MSLRPVVLALNSLQQDLALWRSLHTARKKKQKKGVVIFAINLSTRPSDLQELKTLSSESLLFFDVVSLKELEKNLFPLKRLNQKGGVLIVSSEAIEQPLFEKILLESDFPPLVEGKSSRRFLLSNGIPHFQISGTPSREFAPSIHGINPDFDHALELWNAVSPISTVQFHHQFASLTQFIQNAMNPEGSVRQLMAQIAKLFNDPHRDALIYGLSRAAEIARTTESPGGADGSTPDHRPLCRSILKRL